MIGKVAYPAAVLLSVLTLSPASGGSGDSAGIEPGRYVVRYGASLGTFEPIAGEALCILGEDCAIPLLMWPEVKIRLRSSPTEPDNGTATIVCPATSCGLASGSSSVPYSGTVNELNIYDRTDDRAGFVTLLVIRRKELLGRFSFVISH